MSRKIHCSVLLLNDKIIDWKVGKHKKEVPEAFLISFIKCKFESSNLKVKNKTFISNERKDTKEIYEVKAKDFMKNWEIHKSFAGFYLPY
jgi:hypothetical protein